MEQTISLNSLARQQSHRLQAMKTEDGAEHTLLSSSHVINKQKGEPFGLRPKYPSFNGRR